MRLQGDVSTVRTQNASDRTREAARSCDAESHAHAFHYVFLIKLWVYALGLSVLGSKMLVTVIFSLVSLAMCSLAH